MLDQLIKLGAVLWRSAIPIWRRSKVMAEAVTGLPIAVNRVTKSTTSAVAGGRLDHGELVAAKARDQSAGRTGRAGRDGLATRRRRDPGNH
jgi:hypothetical protein